MTGYSRCLLLVRVSANTALNGKGSQLLQQPGVEPPGLNISLG